jgi:hypothetical protein
LPRFDVEIKGVSSAFRARWRPFTDDDEVDLVFGEG